MKNFAGVRQALVIDRTDERGQKYLCGYVVADSSFDLERLVGPSGRRAAFPYGAFAHHAPGSNAAYAEREDRP